MYDYDSDNDGYINFTEFMMIFLIMFDGSSEEVLTKIVRVFDVDSNGTITKKELLKLIKDMHSLFKEEDPAAKDLVAQSAWNNYAEGIGLHSAIPNNFHSNSFLNLDQTVKYYVCGIFFHN